MNGYGLARLGRDAELRSTPGGDSVATLALAFTRRVKGEKLTQWVDAALWGKRAESLAPYLLKGGLVSVLLDDVHIETYQGAKGEGHKLAARVLDLELAGGNGESRAAAPAQARPQTQPPKAAPAPRQGGSSGFDDMDDDIPFADPMKRRAFALSI